MANKYLEGYLSPMHGKKICTVVIAVLLSLCFGKESDPSECVNVMCGPHCLWLAAKCYGVTTDLKRLRYFAETDATRGTSLKNMLKTVRTLELEPLLLNADWAGLQDIKRPAILLINQPLNGHYVFLEDIGHETISVLDPPSRKVWMRKEFMDRFTGIVIVVCRDVDDRLVIEGQFKSKGTLGRVLSPLIIMLLVLGVVVIGLFSSARRKNGIVT